MLTTKEKTEIAELVADIVIKRFEDNAGRLAGLIMNADMHIADDINFNIVTETDKILSSAADIDQGAL